jgi:hypothetical protein
MSINPLSSTRFAYSQQNRLNPKVAKQREGIEMFDERTLREYLTLYRNVMDEFKRSNRHLSGDLLDDLLAPLSRSQDSFILESPSCSGPLDSSWIVFSTELGEKGSALRKRQQDLIPLTKKFFPWAKKVLVLPIAHNEAVDLEIRGDRIFLELSLFDLSDLKELHTFIQKVVNCYETRVTQNFLPSVMPSESLRRILNITDPN